MVRESANFTFGLTAEYTAVTGDGSVLGEIFSIELVIFFSELLFLEIILATVSLAGEATGLEGAIGSLIEVKLLFCEFFVSVLQSSS